MPKPRSRKSRTEDNLGRKGMGTRARLVRAAAVIFARDGFVDARIQDIAKEAGTAHGTFYTYFETKDSIFRVVIDEMIELFHTRAQIFNDDEDPYERLETGMRNVYDAWSENRELLNALDQVAAIHPDFMNTLNENRRAYVAEYAGAIRRLQDDGRVYADIDPEHAASAYASLIDNTMRWWIGRGEPHDVDKAIGTIATIWERGIGLRRDAPRVHE